ncbi:MAG: twin-arginine translocase TatA/TatE family subunit [Chloroflexi bacterium]|nr:twin-arginine translocase TatA/TatE family subunit [Chloroflexota bacterium]MBP7045638.1 twin-arginine translocase TatA/TatE family subunit [Chloroflexota bacterium]
MDSFFGIGAPELILILFLAGIVMGPQRIRQVAYWLGKTTAQLQAIARGFSRQLNAELDAVDGSGELRDTMKEMQDLRRQMADLRREVTSIASVPFEESRRAVQESQKLSENSIRPPQWPNEKKANETAVSHQTEISLPKPIDVADDPD